MAVAGCGSPGNITPGVGLAEASFLTDDLLQVTVPVTGDPSRQTLRMITDCAAAEAVLLRDAGFARHVRTAMVEEGGNRRADAVYSVSKEVPRGNFVLDVAVQAEACRELEEAGVTANYG